MKKLTFVLVLLTILSAGAWLVLRYAPQWIPNSMSSESTTHTSVPALDSAAANAEYAMWRDSIDALDLAIRSENDPRLIKMNKERQLYFWNKLSAARKAIPTAQDSQGSNPAMGSVQASDDTQGLIKLLSKVLTATAVILVILIVMLLLMLKRKRDALTRQLEALHEDDRFKMPRNGFSERPASIADRPAAIIPDSSMDAPIATTRVPRPERTNRPSPNSIPATGAFPTRPTARQRVTNALKGLAEALATLKDDKSDVPQNQTRVRSRNEENPDQTVLQPSRFDREKEEKSEILKLARRGFTSSEIARRLRVSQDQVETIIRLQRESGS